jgi:release factor glutamine methyltransferase
LLLQHVLKRDHVYLVAHDEVFLTVEQAGKYEALLARAADREPIPYLVGQAPFFGHSFTVSPAVLIPRPETELLIEAILKKARERPFHQIADVGTGSGCIAITLARRLPEAQVSAIDISEKALAIAKRNARSQDLGGSIDFYQGHLLEPLPTRPDLVVANLPYVTDQEWTALDVGVKWYEPATALKGGPDGLDLVRQLLNQAKNRLAPDGIVYLEIGWRQGPAVERLARETFTSVQVEVKTDYAGHDRLVRITPAYQTTD